MVKQLNLTAEQAHQYGVDGIIPLPGVFKDWVDLLRAGVEKNLTSPGEFATDSIQEEGRGRFLDDYCNWQRISEYHEFATQSPCSAIAEQAMQCRARLFHEHLVMKSAGTAKATPWHHDISYYCVEGTQSASIWIALDPVPLPNAVQFVAGSHLSGKTYYPKRFLDNSNYDYPSGDYSEIPNLSSEEMKMKILRWECQPGDAVMFDFRTLHGTSAAKLEGPRRAIAWRWLGDDMVFHQRPGRTSPPYPELKLSTGDCLPAELFPTLPA